MRISFSQWLRNSNEAKPFRDAFEINENMPLENGIRLKCFEAIQRECENAWDKTKKDLST